MHARGNRKQSLSILFLPLSSNLELDIVNSFLTDIQTFQCFLCSLTEVSDIQIIIIILIIITILLHSPNRGNVVQYLFLVKDGTDSPR